MPNLSPTAKAYVSLILTTFVGAVLGYLAPLLNDGVPPESKWKSMAVSALVVGGLAVWHRFAPVPASNDGSGPSAGSGSLPKSPIGGGSNPRFTKDGSYSPYSSMDERKSMRETFADFCRVPFLGACAVLIAVCFVARFLGGCTPAKAANDVTVVINDADKICVIGEEVVALFTDSPPPAVADVEKACGLIEKYGPAAEADVIAVISLWEGSDATKAMKAKLAAKKLRANTVPATSHTGGITLADPAWTRDPLATR